MPTVTETIACNKRHAKRTEGIEHIGSIIRRLRGLAEARTTHEFDPALSLELDLLLWCEDQWKEGRL